MLSFVSNQETQWENLIGMQKYLGNVKGTLSYTQIVNNSYADKAIKMSGPTASN
jgi:NitT/TauT family transport system substrate-binding protein